MGNLQTVGSMRRLSSNEIPEEDQAAQARHEAAVVRTLLATCQQLRRLRPEAAYRRACESVAVWLRARLVQRRAKGRRG